MEANLGGDPEAAEIVFLSGAPITVMPFDCSVVGDVRYSREDMIALKESGPAGDFIFKANHDLYDILPADAEMVQVDPAAAAAMLWPDLVLESNEAECHVECSRGRTYGMLLEDNASETPNATVVHKINGAEFKKRTLELFRSQGR